MSLSAGPPGPRRLMGDIAYWGAYILLGTSDRMRPLQAEPPLGMASVPCKASRGGRRWTQYEQEMCPGPRKALALTVAAVHPSCLGTSMCNQLVPWLPDTIG